MSSASVVIINAVECPRFSGEGLTPQSKSGPKARTKVVADGKQVDIPVPLIYDKDSRQGRRRIVLPRGWRSVAKSRGGNSSEVRCFANSE